MWVAAEFTRNPGGTSEDGLKGCAAILFDNRILAMARRSDGDFDLFVGINPVLGDYLSEGVPPNSLLSFDCAELIVAFGGDEEHEDTECLAVSRNSPKKQRCQSRRISRGRP